MLPIGGVREKVLAAHRAGCPRVLLPHQNRKDLHELSERVREQLEFIWCETVEQLLSEAIVDGQVNHHHSSLLITTHHHVSPLVAPH